MGSGILPAVTSDGRVHESQERISMARQVRLTQEGFERLQENLAVERRRLEEQTAVLEDLTSSSDDYDDTGLEEAKRAKAGLEQRVDLLEDQLKRAVIIKGRDLDVVDLGATVTLQDLASQDTFEVQVVSTVEGDILDSDAPKVSDESPLGSALMKKRAGEKISVTHAGRTTQYTIVSIS
jgi:transcription elongation factor GreA